jgi:hypothetical protein
MATQQVKKINIITTSTNGYLMSSVGQMHDYTKSQGQYLDGFASTYLGQKMLSAFTAKLTEVVNEAKEYNDLFPSEETISKAIHQAIMHWNNIPEPKIFPTIDARGRIVLLIISENRGRYAVIVE